MDYSQFLNMHDELSLLAVIVILFLADLFVCGDRKSGVPAKSLSVLPVILLTIQTVYMLLAPKTGAITFGGMYQLTPMMSIVKAVLNVGTLVVFLMSHIWMKRPENEIKQGEFYMLTLSTLLGMYFMISAGHFLMFFIGLELASVPMTALVAYTKKNQESAEASAKYILTALFSSGLLLYGISLLYGTCGTLYFDDMAARLDTSNLVQLIALAFFISGLGFKISLVPFHLWTADTYQGAPTPVTAYLSVISKGSAAFVLFIVLIKVFGPFIDNWNQIFFWIIVVSITLANIFAVRQNNMVSRCSHLSGNKC